MEIEIIQLKGSNVAVLNSTNVLINETQDALDLMADASYNGAHKIVLNEKHIASKFFDLKSGLAGEILQKFSTYNVQLAIVGDFTKYSSKSLKNFIYESNKYGRINFVSSIEEAKECLTK